MMTFARFIFLAAIALSLAGCENLSGNNIRLARAEPLFGEHYDHCFDDPAFLLSVMAPNNVSLEDFSVKSTEKAAANTEKGKCENLKSMLRTYFVNSEIPANNENQSGSNIQTRTNINSIQNIISGPYSGAPASRASALALQRNEVMHALVTISNRKCGIYSAHLKTFDGQTNSVLSLIAIATGGIGGVVNAAGTARALSSVSGIASGSRVALNDAWFSNQTIQVLVAGYEKERSTFLRTMNQRQVCPITHYPVMAGVADAMQYHSQCSLITGLAAAAQAIERSDEPGLDVMRRQLVAMASVTGQAELLSNGLPSNSSEKTKMLARELDEEKQKLVNAEARNEAIANKPTTPSNNAEESDGEDVDATNETPPTQLVDTDAINEKIESIRNDLAQSMTEDANNHTQKINQRFTLNASQAEKLECPFDGGSQGLFLTDKNTANDNSAAQKRTK